MHPHRLARRRRWIEALDKIRGDRWPLLSKEWSWRDIFRPKLVSEPSDDDDDDTVHVSIPVVVDASRLLLVLRCTAASDRICKVERLMHAVLSRNRHMLPTANVLDLLADCPTLLRASPAGLPAQVAMQVVMVLLHPAVQAPHNFGSAELVAALLHPALAVDVIVHGQDLRAWIVHMLKYERCARKIAAVVFDRLELIQRILPSSSLDESTLAAVELKVQRWVRQQQEEEAEAEQQLRPPEVVAIRYLVPSVATWARLCAYTTDDAVDDPPSPKDLREVVGYAVSAAAHASKLAGSSGRGRRGRKTSNVAAARNRRLRRKVIDAAMDRASAGRDECLAAMEGALEAAAALAAAAAAAAAAANRAIIMPQKCRRLLLIAAWQAGVNGGVAAA